MSYSKEDTPFRDIIKANQRVDRKYYNMETSTGFLTVRDSEYQQELLTGRIVSSVQGLLEQIIREAISFVKQNERGNGPKKC